MGEHRCIPHLDLPDVRWDVGVAADTLGEWRVRNPLQQSLCGSDAVLDCKQRSMLLGEEEGHQWVTLFASLTLQCGLTITEQTKEALGSPPGNLDEIICTDAIN